MSLREWKCEIPSLQQYVKLHRHEQPFNHLINPRTEFLNEVKIILDNTSTDQSLEVRYLWCLCNGVPFVVAEKGVSRGCWLAGSSVVIDVTSWEARGWALADDAEFWAGGSWTGTRGQTRRHIVTKLNSEHETLKRKRKETKVKEQK